MPYEATVFRALIASPGDVKAEREAIQEATHTWNSLHSKDFRAVLLPVMWETHSAPLMGERPKAIINKQLVKTCDILIGVFWSRIGTNTGVAQSGTVEEIEEFRRSGKPVMLYFSSAPIDLDQLEQSQYNALSEFKEKCYKNGLVGHYETVDELRESLIRQLTVVMRDLHGGPEKHYFREAMKAFEEVKTFSEAK